MTFKLIQLWLTHRFIRTRAKADGPQRLERRRVRCTLPFLFKLQCTAMQATSKSCGRVPRSRWRQKGDELRAGTWVTNSCKSFSQNLPEWEGAAVNCWMAECMYNYSSSFYRTVHGWTPQPTGGCRGENAREKGQKRDTGREWGRREERKRVRNRKHGGDERRKRRNKKAAVAECAGAGGGRRTGTQREAAASWARHPLCRWSPPEGTDCRSQWYKRGGRGVPGVMRSLGKREEGAFPKREGFVLFS